MAKKKVGNSAVAALVAEQAIEDEAAAEHAPVIDDEAAPKLMSCATEWVHLRDELSDLDAQVKEKKCRADELREKMIPDLMRRAGMVNSQGKGSFTCAGSKIYLETKVYASIRSDEKPVFFAWLKKHGQKDMIQQTVNAQTLSAFVRERRSNGETKDPPGVAVFEETVAKITKVK